MPGYSTTTSAPYSSSTVWNLNSSGLTGTVTNNEAFSVMGKYTYDLGGGFKDDAPTSKLTFFGGYVHIDLSNADHLQNYYNGNTTEGGYVLGGGGAPTRSQPTRSFRRDGLVRLTTGYVELHWRLLPRASGCLYDWRWGNLRGPVPRDRPALLVKLRSIPPRQTARATSTGVRSSWITSLTSTSMSTLASA